jgi:VanZ family protein
VRPVRRPRGPLLRPFHFPSLWVGLWLVAIVATIVVCLLPPPPVAVPRNFDKVEHVLGYTALSIGAVWLFAGMRGQCRAAAGLIALGVALEWAQGALTTTRLADPADALANAAGVLLGLVVAATPAATWLARLDARLGRGRVRPDAPPR